MFTKSRTKQLISIIIFVLISSNFAYADDSLRNATVQHVDTTLESEFIHLHIDADVAVPNGNMLIPVYLSDYARADDGKWKKLFFGSEDAQVKDELAGWDLEQQQIFYPELEHNYSVGSLYTQYHAYKARLYIEYKAQSVMISWYDCKKDAQADGLQTTPEQAKAQAYAWIERLSEGIGWNGITVNTCYAMPASTADGTPIPASEITNSQGNDALFPPFYIVECNRKFGNIPIAVDCPPQDMTAATINGDELQIFIDDNGIFRVNGYYRSYHEGKKEKLNISLTDAMAIVQENMDYVNFITGNSSYEIPEIELCYRLVQTLETGDKDVNVRTEARPAWRFASKTNRQMTDAFVMFVDAITGEVLP